MELVNNHPIISKEDNLITMCNKTLLQDEYKDLTCSDSNGEKMNSTDYNIGQLCRICLTSKETLISSLSDSYKNIYDMFLSVTSIDVHSENQDTIQICKTCKNDLTFCYDFKNKCQKSDFIFKTLISELNINNKDDTTSDLTVAIKIESDNERTKEEQEGHEEKNQFRLHIQDHMETKDQTCVFCSKMFVEFDSLRQSCLHDKSNDPNVRKIEDDGEEMKYEQDDHEDVQYLDDNDYDICVDDSDNISLNLFKTIKKTTQCETKTSGTASIHHRKQSKRRRKSYFCSLCSKKFLKAKTLKVHIKKEHGAEKRPYSCNQCKASFYSEHDLHLHSDIHNKTDTWTCNECHKKFVDRRRFRRHIQRHMETKKHTCAVCGKMFAELYSLRRHERVHTGEALDKLYACHLCEKRYSYRSLLAAHLNGHTGARPCVCPSCGKTFPSQRLLVSHQLVHSDTKPHSCHYCDKTFRHESTRNTHLRTHTGEKPYVCTSCGRTFIQRSNLIRHMRTHTGERPYTCSVCERKFTCGSSLKNHMRTHTGDKPFHCPVCEKRFARVDMSAHMARHTGQRPHACALCPKRFCRPWQLRDHCRQHTGEKPFECAHCTDKFATKSQLMKHFKTHQKQLKAAKKREVIIVQVDNASDKLPDDKTTKDNEERELCPDLGDTQEITLEVTEEVVLQDDGDANTDLLIIGNPDNQNVGS